MLLNRITEFVDPILRRNQNGFRKGRSTTPQILALRRIIEEMRISHSKATIVFVDFAKAFDSVNRNIMVHILSNYGIPDDMIRAIAVMYEDPSSFVNTPDGPTESFVTTTGILQGDTLAPYLFAIVVDYILRHSVDIVNYQGLDVKPNKTTRDRSKFLTDLDYADDIALISSLISNAQQLLTTLEEASKKVGLMLNAKKTEYLSTDDDINHTPITSLNGTVLQRIEDFKYLGSFVVDSVKEFSTPKVKTWSASNRLHQIWKSDISISTKIDLFKACVESILLYGSETWSMTKKLQDSLDGTYTRLLMRVKNISWRQHKTKAEIYGELPSISTIVAQRRTRFAGHCFRAKDQIISDILLMRLRCPNRGRRPFSFLDRITKDTNIALDELPNIMADRMRWKEVVRTSLTAVD